MRGWVPLLIVLLVLLAAGAALSWYFAYGVGDEPPREATIAGLSAPVRIGWHEEGYASIEAQSEPDAYRALGYVHGIDRAWTILLWRQTALGQQAEWFGEGLLPLDGFARRLEINTIAPLAYERLNDEEKALLTAYAAGVNAALKSRTVRLSPELALLEVEPEPWEPWHTLALERLFAWIAAPPPPEDSLNATGADAQDFFASDVRLREWLHLHGFHNGIAWAFRDSQETHFFQRQVYGASALPFFSEVVLQWPGNTLTGASIPGTPFFPAGKTSDRAWSLLPRGRTLFQQALADSAAAPPRYQRLRSKDGREQLITITRTDTRIFFTPPPSPPAPRLDSLALADSLRRDSLLAADSAGTPPGVPMSLAAAGDTVSRGPDSTWTLAWSGFQPVSDFSAWRALAQGRAGEFQLIRAAGLTATPDGQWSVLGTPVVVANLSNGVLVGNTRWAAYVAEGLDSLRLRSDRAITIARLTTEYRSEWASELAPRLVAMIDSIPDRAPLVNEALTYLRNWDYAYDRSSIGASIFDTWIDTYREATGKMPELVVPDTLFFENFRRYQTLAQAISELQDRFGNDLSQWRWENVSPDRRFYPVWSADSLEVPGQGRYASRRFAPISLPGRGHPSTLFWGASPVQNNERLSPAAWAAWVTSAEWDVLMVRRIRLELDRPLGRFRASERVPPPISITPSEPAARTTLLSPPAALP